MKDRIASLATAKILDDATDEVTKVTVKFQVFLFTVMFEDLGQILCQGNLTRIGI